MRIIIEITNNKLQITNKSHSSAKFRVTLNVAEWVKLQAPNSKQLILSSLEFDAWNL